MTNDDAQKSTSVAIIGGGIAGLSCASFLKSSQTLHPVVFDTGRLRPGGRCSSRFPKDAPRDNKSKMNILSDYIIDHAAQIITVSDKTCPFGKQVQKWVNEGVLKPFPPDSVVEVKPSPSSTYQIHPIQNRAMYYSTNGMGSLPQHIASSSQIQLEQDVWVSPSNGVKYIGPTYPRWSIKSKRGKEGDFDVLVIAHNGKCADRIMSRTPAKELHSLLRVNFSATVPKHGGKRMTLNSIYSLVFALERKDGESSLLSDALSKNTISAFLKHHPHLGFLSCNTKKYPSPKNTNKDIEIWTLLSSPKFGKKYKGPQENLPPELIQEVTSLLLTSLEQSLDLPQNSLQQNILETKLQLWGAAVPLNTWKTSHGFVYDHAYGVGVCGDWLVDPSIEGAWESGRCLAEWMMREEKGSVGLPPDGSFRVSEAVSDASGIGSIPL